MYLAGTRWHIAVKLHQASSALAQVMLAVSLAKIALKKDLVLDRRLLLVKICKGKLVDEA